MKIYAVIMASGRSKRFCGNKLWAEINGLPIIEKTLITYTGSKFDGVSVVSGDEKILALAEKYSAVPVYNPDETDDTAVTIKYGIESLPKDCGGCALAVADQPMFTINSANKLIDFFADNPENICAAGFNGEKRNPVIFPQSLFSELKSLENGQRGSSVIKKHANLLKICEISDEKELTDIDTRNDFDRLKSDCK